MITPGDDYPIHQTPEPVQQVFTSDRNFYDRFFFNGYWREGAPYFAVAMGEYPNLGIIDGAFSVVVDGVQHCVRGSRVMGADRLDTRVGPLSIEIVKPMQQMRIRVNHEAVKAELLFDARAMAIEEPRFTSRSGPRIVMDLTRMTQHGGYTGFIEVAGKRHEAKADRTWGSRDRSWGVRNVGERDPAGVPSPAIPQFFWLWAPTNFEKTCTHFDVNEYSDGSRWHQVGVIAPAEVNRSPEYVTSVDHKITFRPGTRHARRAEIILKSASGKERKVELEVLYNFYMSGIGYFHPRWGHGMWVGTDESTYESFKTAEVDEHDLLFQHIQAVSRARIDKETGGVGILEMIILGPHQPSGFKEFMDWHG